MEKLSTDELLSDALCAGDGLYEVVLRNAARQLSYILPGGDPEDQHRVYHGVLADLHGLREMCQSITWRMPIGSPLRERARVAGMEIEAVRDWISEILREGNAGSDSDQSVVVLAMLAMRL